MVQYSWAGAVGVCAFCAVGVYAFCAVGLCAFCAVGAELGRTGGGSARTGVEPDGAMTPRA